MPLKQFLATCETDLMNQSPIQVVSEIAPNQYIYAGPEDFEVAYIDPQDPNQTLPPPTLVQTKTLIPLKWTIWNGGSVTLDYNFLAPRKHQILNWASSYVGAGCLHLSRTIYNLQFQQLTAINQIDNAIQAIMLGNNPDTTIICSPTITTQIRRNFLGARIRYSQSSRLQTNNLVDYSNPIYTPSVNDKGLMIFDWYNSFVLASPQFSVQNNRLIFEFKMDIADTKFVHAFNT